MSIACVKTSLPGPKGKVLLEDWHKHEPDIVGFQAPVVWDHAQGCIVSDVDGNQFIDWTSGVLVASVGHCHPYLVEKVRDATGRLLNNYESANVERIEAARRLVAALPQHLDKCFFLSTGSEAIEAALRLMKRRSGQYEIIGFEGAFHGRTAGAAALGGLAGPKKGYGPPVAGVIRAPYPNPYRDESGWCADGPEFKRYFDHLDSIVRAQSTGNLAGVLVEPYLGAGGFVFPPEGWLKQLEAWTRSRGLLFALDEVQSSFGRTGAMWAMEHEGLNPDIVVLGKGIGCGIPVSAVASNRDVFSSLKKGEMSSTLGGNPLSSAAVSAILDIHENEGLVENSLTMGGYMKKRLHEISEKCPYLGDVRGMGLVMGLEFVKDKATKEPAAELIRPIIENCAREGLLVGAVGIYGNVIRVAPPLIINREEADESLAIMGRVLINLRLEGEA